jgi:preprotein translocase subunit SecE
MARLQRKKLIGAKKKKLDSEAVASEATVAMPVVSPNKPAVSSTKKKASMPAKRGSGTTKSASSGKIKGIIDQSIQFLREVKVELKKVAWPSRKQTIGSTAVVLILVFIISAFLGVVDMGLSSLVRLVLQ